MPLRGLRFWAPFQIDALGLVTLFGAREMNRSIGNLTQSWITEWLPTLGSYAVANDEILEPDPGFVLYNITDQIMATDVSTWFTRWLISYPLTYTATTITLTSNTKPMSSELRACSILIGGLTLAVPLLFAILTEDWWGFANVIALCLTVIVRQQMVGLLRSSINKNFEDAMDDPGDEVKAFLTIPNGKAVTIRGSRQVVVNCLLTNPQPPNPTYYFILKAIGWGAFGVHAVALGMTALFNQILCVVMLLVCTYLTAVHVGDDHGVIGNRLRLDVDMGDPKWNRSSVYARLDMSEEEENCMVQWSILPQRSNVWWWNRYRQTCIVARQKDLVRA